MLENILIYASNLLLKLEVTKYRPSIQIMISELTKYLILDLIDQIAHKLFIQRRIVA